MCMYLCIYVSMYVFMHVCNPCMYVCMYVCMYACMIYDVCVCVSATFLFCILQYCTMKFLFDKSHIECPHPYFHFVQVFLKHEVFSKVYDFLK